ncbi:MAG: carbohydrate binding domain-containing protein [Bacteroidota bacterium]
MKNILLTLIGAFILAGAGLNAQNLVVNGDFETGVKAPWNSWNNAVISDEANVYEGTWSGRLNNNKPASFFQVITVTPGNTYDVSFTAKWGADPGWYSGLMMDFVSNDGLKTILGGTSPVNTLDWTTIEEQITVPPGYSEVRVTLYKPKTPACFVDSVSVVDLGAIRPALKILSDGEITEKAEDGEVIGVSLLNDNFAASLDAANWSFDGLPDGISIASVTRVDADSATITLSGNSTEDYDSNLNLRLTIAAAEFEAYAADVTTGMFVTFTGIDEPPPAITLTSDGEIKEDFEDGEVITLAMDDDTFVDPLTPANWSAVNFPEGVTIGSLQRVNDTAVVITIAGNTTGDYDIDITDAGFSIAEAEFAVWIDPVEITGGFTFQATVEGGEVVLWEENFDNYADGTDLTDTVGGNDYGFSWQHLDSAMVYGGVLKIHPSHTSVWDADTAHHRFQHLFTPIEMGKTYIFYGDSRSDDGSDNVMSVLVGEDGQFKTEPSGSTEWRTRSVVVEPYLPGHDTAGVGFYKWGWENPDMHIYIDNLKFVVLTEPKISAAVDGDGITEGAEDGEVITVTLQNDTYAASLDVNNWSVVGLPAGVTVGSVNRVDDTHAGIVLSGDATEDYDVDLEVVVSAGRDELVTSTKKLTSEAVVLTAIDEPPTIAISDDGEIKEGAEDLEVITVVLALDTFVTALTPANWSLTGQPAGVGIGEVYRVDDLTVEITLAGNTSEDYDMDITDATVTVAAAELKNYDQELSASIGVTFIATIEDAVADNMIAGLQLYPNPVTDRLYINAGAEMASLKVYNALGTQITNLSDLNARSLQISTGDWGAGLYFIEITDAESRQSVVKVVK